MQLENARVRTQIPMVALQILALNYIPPNNYWGLHFRSCTIFKNLFVRKEKENKQIIWTCCSGKGSPKRGSVQRANGAPAPHGTSLARFWSLRVDGCRIRQDRGISRLRNLQKYYSIAESLSPVEFFHLKYSVGASFHTVSYVRLVDPPLCLSGSSQIKFPLL